MYKYIFIFICINLRTYNLKKRTTNDKHVCFLKCAEELNELAVELLHAANKPNKNNWGKISDELEDVRKWIKALIELKDE